MPEDSIHITPVPDQKVTAVLGNHLRGHFPRHAHHSLVLGMVDSGVRRIEMGRSAFLVHPGELFVIPPQQGHRCTSENHQPHTYRVLCLPPDTVPVLKHLPTPLVESPEASELFQCYFKLIPPEPHSLPEREQIISELLLAVVTHCQPTPFPPEQQRPLHPGILAAMTAIAKTPSAEHSLDDLAQIACLSKFHLQRLFVTQTGMSPADYRLQCRISRALHLIVSGTPLTEAGLACGFADQSHFTRAFRHAVGVPPGRFLHHNPPEPSSKG
ncbi:helix-turn-helix domain-containing protein [Desulfovibrio ferrophilus]|uniref:Transcriptional regulator, AraC family n=1 Tax=Desulfovibrio ferrophilus TaxID=241368 RepID=A0A2Z6AVL0_9BACT|nr:AraC family transcriptional regulator [Desulfovibrio ferrophilus]BBD07253.1 transcriptional regulator, AraC family [Desulfovibrio ferrophilus]